MAESRKHLPTLVTGSKAAPFLHFRGSPPEWTFNPSCLKCAETSSSTISACETSIDSDSTRSDSSYAVESDISKPSFFQCPSMYDQVSVSLQRAPEFVTRKSSILKDLAGKAIFLFLDYDGTLTPIVSDPCQATLSDTMRELLVQLATVCDRVNVGIVTGRALNSVKSFVKITATENLNFLYAASHGFHIEAAGKQLHHKVGARFIPALRAAALKVADKLGHISGVTLEDNEFAVSVHYRNAPDGSEEEVEHLVDEVLASYPNLKKTRGKMVFELRINLLWDKGRAVSWLLNAMEVDPFDSDTRIIYIGDDLTDEDAFKMLRQLGTHTLPVLVCDTPESRPTAALVSVKDTSEVAEFLTELVHLTMCRQETKCHA